MLQPSPTTDRPKKSRQLRPLLNVVLVVAILAGALVFSFTTQSEAHAASVVANTSCATKQSNDNTPDAFGVNLFWVSMKTTWCWNDSIVTSHSTILYWGVTTTGNIAGWYSLYNPQYTFNCYVAAGSSHNCSGNHEWMQEDFVHGITPFEDCYLSINQWETYNGGFTWNDSHHCVPN
jgi:hypothetical protein